MRTFIIPLFLVATVADGASDRPKATISAVESLFVSGNNQAAEKVREVLERGKTCFTLAPKASDADAVLEITTDTQSQGGMIGGFGGRTWIVSGTLTLKNGDLVWSGSERFGDAPFMSGGKTAAAALVRKLAKAGCRRREH